MMSNTMASSSDNPNSMASSSANQTPPLATFHPFRKFPREIRDMIWKESIVDHPRVITIDHCRYQGLEDGLLVSRAKNISEEIPVLLITCSESRKVMLKLVDEMYHSVFKTPKVGNMKYHYAGDMTCKVIAKIAFGLVPRPFDRSCTTALGYMQQINLHLNRSLPAVVPHYVALLAREIGPIFPAYFSPVLDTLYIRGDGGRRAHNGPYFLSGLWAPTRSHHAAKIQSLAIELDRRVYLNKSSNYQIRVWTSVPSYRLCTGLKSLYLVCLEDKEVIQFSFDESNTLVGDQWIYSLETGSTLFEKEMGENWTGVLWKVEFKKTSPSHLWYCARGWKCSAVKWEKEKRSVCKDNDEVPEEWFDAERVRGVKEKGKGNGAKVVNGVKYAARGEGWYKGNSPITWAAVGR